MRVPKYRRHKSTGRALVEINGKRTYLGKFGSPESRERYAQIIRDLEQLRTKAASPPPPPRSNILIEELILTYWQERVTVYYVKRGRPTSEQAGIKAALRWLLKLYGDRPARSLDVLMLESVRNEMLRSGANCRKTINRHISQVRRMYKWAAKRRLIEATVWHELRTLDDLKSGRSAALDPPEVEPVSDETVEATLPYLSTIVAGMVRFQRLTGCRPGEVCSLRPIDVERPDESGAAGEAATLPTPDRAAVWCYRPQEHKTEHHGSKRLIHIGPKAQGILRPFLTRDPEAHCFNPQESAVAEKPVERATTQRERAERPRPGRRGMRYTTGSYRKAIHRACERAFNMPAELRQISARLSAAKRAELHRQAREWRERFCWSPNQLRHTLADVVDAEFDLIGVQSVLGHKHAKTSEIYTRRDAAFAAKIMGKIG